MIRHVKAVEKFNLRASDGEIGTVKDLFFDDEHWHVRYFAVDTGSWLTGRTVLIAPSVVTSADWSERVLHVTLTKEQVRNSPHVDTERPVSRQQEAALRDYYAWPYYWGAPALGTGYVAPFAPAAMPMAGAERAGLVPDERSRAGETRGAAAPSRPAEPEGDSHLRSARAVCGYGIDATDGSLGHVEDLMVDDATWAVRYFVVDTRNWWPGKLVTVRPSDIRAIDWASSAVAVDLTRDAIKSGPEYDYSRAMTEEYVERLEAHYDRARGRTKTK